MFLSSSSPFVSYREVFYVAVRCGWHPLQSIPFVSDELFDPARRDEAGIWFVKLTAVASYDKLASLSQL
jgi:hypothetical protein